MRHVETDAYHGSEDVDAAWRRDKILEGKDEGNKEEKPMHKERRRIQTGPLRQGEGRG
jgi:hypothetical protein